VDQTPPPHGAPSGADRPGRVPGRRQSLAAAAANRATRDARLGALVGQYRVAYAQAVAQGRRLPAEFNGFRGGRLVASIASRPVDPTTAVEPFRLACRTLAALGVGSVALLVGDELALTVTASADHPSDLSPFVVGLTFGPAGVDPAGTLVPYQLDRTGTVGWGAPRPVRASTSQGLWVEVLGPMCLARASVAGKPMLADLLVENRRLGHVVLQL
jgi:hypothetical protein